jgi:sporulation protein YtfJ
VPEHPIQGLMKTAMESIREMVDVNTIVGDPVETEDGSVIMPISRVSFGFAAGGAEYGTGGVRRAHEKPQMPLDRSAEDGASGGLPFGGGSGAGVTIRPVGFLVVGNGQVRMLPVDGRAIYDRLIDVAPQLLQELRSAIVGNGGSYARTDSGLGAPLGSSAGRRVRPRPEV